MRAVGRSLLVDVKVMHQVKVPTQTLGTTLDIFLSEFHETMQCHVVFDWQLPVFGSHVTEIFGFLNISQLFHLLFSSAP